MPLLLLLPVLVVILTLSEVEWGRTPVFHPERPNSAQRRKPLISVKFNLK
jgi:hypothetical protein